MNKCKCFDCGYSWFVPQKTNGHTPQHACPRCGSDKVQYMVDSLIHELHASVTVIDPTILCMPSGFSKALDFKNG